MLGQTGYVDKDGLQAGSHWRMEWPYGVVDNGQDDGDIIERFNKPAYTEIKKKKEKFPWEYDSDIIHTGNSIEIAEGIVGDKLTHESVAHHRGRDMVFENNVHGNSVGNRDDAPPA